MTSEPMMPVHTPAVSGFSDSPEVHEVEAPVAHGGPGADEDVGEQHDEDEQRRQQHHEQHDLEDDGTRLGSLPFE